MTLIATVYAKGAPIDILVDRGGVIVRDMGTGKELSRLTPGQALTLVAALTYAAAAAKEDA